MSPGRADIRFAFHVGRRAKARAAARSCREDQYVEGQPGKDLSEDDSRPSGGQADRRGDDRCVPSETMIAALSVVMASARAMLLPTDTIAVETDFAIVKRPATMTSVARRSSNLGEDRRPGLPRLGHGNREGHRRHHARGDTSRLDDDRRRSAIGAVGIIRVRFVPRSGHCRIEEGKFPVGHDCITAAVPGLISRGEVAEQSRPGGRRSWAPGL